MRHSEPCNALKSSYTREDENGYGELTDIHNGDYLNTELLQYSIDLHEAANLALNFLGVNELGLGLQSAEFEDIEDSQSSSARVMADLNRMSLPDNFTFETPVENRKDSTPSTRGTSLDSNGVLPINMMNSFGVEPNYRPHGVDDENKIMHYQYNPPILLDSETGTCARESGTDPVLERSFMSYDFFNSLEPKKGGQHLGGLEGDFFGLQDYYYQPHSHVKDQHGEQRTSQRCSSSLASGSISKAERSNNLGNVPQRTTFSSQTSLMKQLQGSFSKNILYSKLREPVSCTHCDHSFESIWDLASHFEEFKINTAHKCPFDLCPFHLIGFSRKADLRRHCFQKHSEKVKSKDSISGDIKNILNNLIYSCKFENCKKNFYRKDSLQRHLKLVHENENSKFNKKLKKMQRMKTVAKAINPK